MNSLRKHIKIYLFILAGILLLNTFLRADEVKHVVFDLDGVITQANQEFLYNGKNLYPALEEITISLPLTEKQNIDTKYFLKYGVREFLEYLVLNKIKISVLSYIPQKKLNKILAAISIKDKSLFDHSEYVFGKEAIDKFHTQFHEKSKISKDQRIVFDENSKKWSDKLKENDLSILDSFSTLNTKLGSDILFLDTKPATYLSSQIKNVYQIISIEKDKEYWNRCSFEKTEEHMGRFENAIQREQFLSEIEAERIQFHTLMSMIQYVKTNNETNDLRFWEKLSFIPRVLIHEKIQFRYLIPDFAIRDQANQEVLFLGNDVDLFYEALNTVRTQLKLKGNFNYIPLNEDAFNRNAYNPKNISQIFEKYNIKSDEIIDGVKKLRFVESGYYETASGSILQYILGDKKTWQSHVLNVSSFRFTSLLNGSEPYQFKSLESYLDFTAYVEPLVHQNRIGADSLREVLWYMRLTRPKSDKIVKNSKEEIILNTMREYIQEYYKRSDVVEWLQKRVLFLTKKPVFYPSFWKFQEPLNLDIGFNDRSKLNTLTQSVKYVEAIRKENAIEKYWKFDEGFYSIYPIKKLVFKVPKIIDFTFDTSKAIEPNVQNRTLASPELKTQIKN